MQNQTSFFIPNDGLSFIINKKKKKMFMSKIISSCYFSHVQNRYICYFETKLSIDSDISLIISQQIIDKE